MANAERSVPVLSPILESREDAPSIALESLTDGADLARTPTDEP
jgi:hypothetical protein